MPKKAAVPSGAPSGHARNWTPEQRRSAFAAARQSSSTNHQILESDFQEEFVPFNHIVLDQVLGIKGLVRHGTVYQVHGDEGAGKSSTAGFMAGSYQQATGEPVGYMDFEGSTTPAFLEQLGMDRSLLQYMRPTSVQEAIKEHVRLLDQGVRLFVNDSIPYMETKSEKKDILSNKAFKANYGGNAKAMGLFYRMLRPYLQEYDAALIMVNQTRDRIDSGREAMYATKYDYINRIYSLPGGRWSRFAPSVMLELTLEKALAPKPIVDQDTDELFILDVCAPGEKLNPSLNRVRFRTLKNKPTGAGFRKGDVYIRPGYGPDETVSILELARQFRFISNAGAKWWVGRSSEEAFARYSNKAEAVEALVVKRDMTVLTKLRELVYAAVNENTDMFKMEVSKEEIDLLNDESKSTTSFTLEEDEEV